MTTRPPVFEDPENYPGKVLDQPWAGLIWLAGMGWPGKTIESRKTRIHYRGPLIICASLTSDGTYLASAHRRLVVSGIVPEKVFLLACGAQGVALAKFVVAGHRPFLPTDADAAFFQAPTGRHAWLASSIAALEPFQVRGGQGFIRVPRSLVDAAVLTETVIAGGA